MFQTSIQTMSEKVGESRDPTACLKKLVHVEMRHFDQ